MAKYDWKQLEKEYILSNYNSVSSFLKSKDIKNNGTTRKHTVGWKDKKRQNEDKKATKIIEKVTEKESQKEAEKILQVKDVANDLLIKIAQANNELNTHLAKSKKKTKTVKVQTVIVYHAQRKRRPCIYCRRKRIHKILFPRQHTLYHNIKGAYTAKKQDDIHANHCRRRIPRKYTSQTVQHAIGLRNMPVRSKGADGIRRPFPTGKII